MADPVSQTYSNHTRYDPPFHFFVLPVFAITLILSIVHLIRRPGLHSAWMLVVMVAAVVAVFKIRLYALKVQDRVIRLEERMRLANLLGESLLDSESEAYIQQGLKYLMEGRTTFVIAHRLSTIRQADQILVVEAGKIVERGKHEHLLALKGRYHDLYMRQHGLETNLFLAPGEGDKVEEATASGRGGAGDPDAISLIRGGGSSL